MVLAPFHMKQWQCLLEIKGQLCTYHCSLLWKQMSWCHAVVKRSYPGSSAAVFWVEAQKCIKTKIPSLFNILCHV